MATMKIKTMSVRDLVHEGKELGSEMVEIQNKKTGKYLGIFVPYQYAPQVKATVKKTIDKEVERKLKRVMSFAGTFSGVFPKDKKAIQKIKSQMG
jgi:hypothetical protein